MDRREVTSVSHKEGWYLLGKRNTHAQVSYKSHGEHADER